MEYVALFDFSPSKEEQDELAFKKGEVLKVLIMLILNDRSSDT